MKTYKLSILFLFVFLAIQGINAQSVYNIGGHSIYYNDGQYFKITSNDTITIIKDKIIIKFKDNISEVDKNIFSSDFGLTFVNASKHGITVYLIDETNNFLDFIAALSMDVRIKYYDLNFELSYFNIEPPNNDVPESIWNSNEEVMWPYDNTQLYDAWSITHGIPEIIVANLPYHIYRPYFHYRYIRPPDCGITRNRPQNGLGYKINKSRGVLVST